MGSGYHVAVVGATGAVGQEMLAVLQKRRFPVRTLTLLASPRSKGKRLRYGEEQLAVEVLTKDAFKGVEIALFSAGGSRAKEFAPAAVSAGAVVVDNSSAFRMEAGVPLVVPEINPETIRQHQGIIANPNCSTIAMVVPLYPLHKAFGVKRVVVCTYQAASGAGAAAMEELKAETLAQLEGRPYQRTIFPQQYAFNLFPHNSPLLEDGYCEEEVKMVRETHKIMGDSSIRINATCVRVPVLRAHSEALNIEFQREVAPAAAYDVLRRAPGIEIHEDRAANRWATPVDGSGQDPVLVGRIRTDRSQPNTLDLWLVSDQLLKGAALNAVQIAELL
ncbi:MAG: aspartate-semialdehyde dehydrogenase [Candidatus Lambdaproteobacteria bacterium]|nr:aspartate-semialdehyde dehydrogenase [Candidatus Lambdaproteobacteria bacterium]